MVERVDYLSKVQYAERKMIDDPRGGQLMEKFSEIVYTRPDAKAAEASARQYLEQLKQAWPAAKRIRKTLRACGM